MSNHKTHQRLFAAQLLSQFGDKLMLIAMLWYLTKSGSASVVSWYLGLSTLPHLLLMPFSARAIARLGGELPTVIITDILRGALLLSFALAWPHLGAQQVVASLFVISFLLNALGALFNPAMMSLPPRLAADESSRQKITARLESCFSLSAVFAPLLATALYGLLGLVGVIAFNGVSYLVAAWLEAKVSLLPGCEIIDEKTETAPTVRSFERSVRVMLVCFFAMNLFLGPVLVFLPLFAQQFFGGRLGALAALEAALGVGTVVGTLGLALVPLPGTTRTKINGALVAVALCYLGFVLSRGLPFGIGFVALLGLFLAIANVVILGFFQARPYPAEIVRLMTWVNLISVASLPVSMALVGVALSVWALPHVALACAGLLILVTATSALAMGKAA